MASLPVLSGKEVVRVFGRFGWRVARQSSSHIIMTKDNEIATLSNSRSQGTHQRNPAQFDSRRKFDHR